MIDEQQLARYCNGDFTEIENYADALADTTQTWHCHHRKEITEDGNFAYSREDLIKMEDYYNRPSEELIFLTESEHMRIHGKGISDATRDKMSKSKKGKRYALKHHDITVSQEDDKNAYARAYYLKNKEYHRQYHLKNKEKNNARDLERYYKKKALAAK